MEQRQFHLIAFLACLSTSVYANAEKKDVELQKSESKDNTELFNPRSPIQTPSVSIDDYTLSFDSSCIGCPVAILQDGLTVYIATVGNDLTVELPDYLSGVYEIQLQGGSITFVGEIEL